MIEKGEKPWLIRIISKRNDSVNIILCALHVRVSALISNDNN